MHLETLVKHFPLKNTNVVYIDYIRLLVKTEKV